MRRPGRRRNVKVDVHGVFVGQKDAVGGEWECRSAGLQECRSVRNESDERLENRIVFHRS